MAAKQNATGMRYAGLGFELAASVLVLTLLGWWVDRHFGSTPWGVLSGALIGLVGGMYNLVRQALEAVRPSDGTDRDEADRNEDDRPTRPRP
jgi:ATP synthase protein I